MILRALFLTYYHLKRIVRSGRIWMVLLVIPFVMAAARIVFPSSSVTLTLLWVCPFLCAVLTLGLIHLQREKDTACGLEAGFRASPMPASSLLASRAAAWASIFLAQMAVFTLVLLIRS